MPHRCALGCVATDVVMHVFPNPKKYPERFKIWVSLTGDDLKMLSDEEIYKKKRICDVHFTENHRNRFKRLNALAVPSLYLPSQPRTQGPVAMIEAQPLATIPVGIAQSVDSTRAQQSIAAVEVDHVVSLPVVPGQGPPRTQGPVMIEAQPLATIPVGIAQSVDSTRAQQQSIAAVEVDPVVSLSVVPGQDQNNMCTSTNLLAEHNYSAASKRRPRLCTGAGNKSIANWTKPLQRKIKYLQNEISSLRKKGKSFKERLANATKMSNNLVFQKVAQHMTKPAQLFMHMQLQSKKKPKGRRFTTEEKILSLSIFKKSPKCYRLLCKYFSLPSSRSMKLLLSKIQIGPGINKIIFEKIRKNLLNQDITKRLCSLIFDEMSITPQIFYTANKDKLEGFTSNNSFADHVLVFMIKGVKNNYKQPIAYYFTNSLKKIELKKYIKIVLEHCFKSKLVIINTVCDQSPVNVSAITEMVEETKATYLRLEKEWRHDVIDIKGHSIVPLYDTPHLIKGLRNNLITKDLIYVTNGQEKTIKWDYYLMIKAGDKTCKELSLLDKITDEHIIPEKINKMRVKSATQLFSHSVAVAASHLTEKGTLPAECAQVIDFTLLINNLFDSLNVSSLSIPNGKIYKGGVKRNSPHHDLWKKAKEILKTVKYLKKVKVDNKIRFVETVVPSVTNLIKTIEGMECLWVLLSQKYGLDIMLTRNFNQDPLENFFGNIRSYGARNVAPNTLGFEGAFKSLLLNNFNSPHSQRANCEEDFNECLQSLEFFLTENVEETPDTSEETNIHFSNEICFEQQTPDNDAGQRNYVCGFVLRKCLKDVVKGCKACKNTLLDDNNINNAFIKAKEYNGKKWLCYPSQNIETYFKEMQNMAISFLKNEVPKTCLKKTIISFSDMLIDNDPFECPVHGIELKKKFVDTSLNVIIYSWCRSINRILSGKLTYDGDGEDLNKLAAQNYYDKHKHYKNRK